MVDTVPLTTETMSQCPGKVDSRKILIPVRIYYSSVSQMDARIATCQCCGKGIYAKDLAVVTYEKIVCIICHLRQLSWVTDEE